MRMESSRNPVAVDEVVIFAFLVYVIGTGEGNREVLWMAKERAAMRAYMSKATRKWFPESLDVFQFVLWSTMENLSGNCPC